MVNTLLGSEFWLISTRSQNNEISLADINKKVSSFATVYEFKVPEFKVGTLDTLVILADHLQKNDLFIEGVLKKICHVVKEIMEDRYDKIIETLVVGPSYETRMDDYFRMFNWDLARYQLKQPLKTLVELIMKQVVQIDRDHKVKTTNYFNVRNALAQEFRKNTGSLVNRSLRDLVRKEDFVIGSEFMKTLLIVVPKFMFEKWWNVYESLAEMVVPRSSKLIHEDNENCLVNVTVFKKCINEFKENAKSNKFIVREFEYNEAEIQEKIVALGKLQAERDKYHSILVKWLKVNFSETFIAWIHLKGIRLFVESVIRYGLPVQFQCLLVHTNNKNNQRLKELVDQFIGDKVSKGDKINKQFITDLKDHAKNHDIEKIIGVQNEIYNYVYFKVKTTFLE